MTTAPVAGSASEPTWMARVENPASDQRGLPDVGFGSFTATKLLPRADSSVPEHARRRERIGARLG
ncbi:hypothetical protein GCM10022223_00910 [Kineosporia mesophila]|uniref:Uncharacterized protein n=1 Tax=Kineosporia mesophila TaxID=566012 RepID=A0ABP6YY76_9ACTN